MDVFAKPLFVDLRPTTTVLELCQRRIDEVHEFRVALGNANPVRLLGERRRKKLGGRILLRETQKDYVVRADGVNGFVPSGVV